MDSVAADFFKRILETPSPSGFERPVQELVRKYVADVADEVSTDLLLSGYVLPYSNGGVWFEPHPILRGLRDGL